MDCFNFPQSAKEFDLSLNTQFEAAAETLFQETHAAASQKLTLGKKLSVLTSES